MKIRFEAVRGWDYSSWGRGQSCTPRAPPRSLSSWRGGVRPSFLVGRAAPPPASPPSECSIGEFRFCSHVPASATNTCLKPHFNAPPPLGSRFERATQVVGGVCGSRSDLHTPDLRQRLHAGRRPWLLLVVADLKDGAQPALVARFSRCARRRRLVLSAPSLTASSPTVPVSSQHANSEREL